MKKEPTSKLDVASIVPVEPTPAPAAPTKKPTSVTICDPMHVAMQKLAHLVRAGYTPSMDHPMQAFDSTGFISMTLVLGNPDESFRTAAQQEIEHSAAMEELAYRKDVEQAAARQIKEAAEAAAAVKKAALLAEQKQALAAIEAEIAALSK